MTSSSRSRLRRRTNWSRSASARWGMDSEDSTTDAGAMLRSAGSARSLMRRLLALSILFVAALGSAPAGAAPPARHASLPAVAPDGRAIAFVSDREGGRWDLYTIRADGTDLVQLTHSGEEELVPAWTRDGREVLYMTVAGDSTVLHAVPLVGGPARTVVARVAKGIVLSNDGRRIAYTLGSWTRNRLMVADLDGSNAVALSDSSTGFFNLAWSPDDRWIA